mgnify:CR=1 FL=1
MGNCCKKKLRPYLFVVDGVSIRYLTTATLMEQEKKEQLLQPAQQSPPQDVEDSRNGVLLAPFEDDGTPLNAFSAWKHTAKDESLAIAIMGRLANYMVSKPDPTVNPRTIPFQLAFLVHLLYSLLIICDFCPRCRGELRE